MRLLFGVIGAICVGNEAYGWAVFWLVLMFLYVV